MAEPVNPAVLNALTLKWGRDKANLDDQDNRSRINYNSALEKMGRNYQDTELKNRQGLSDRGMIHSGPALQSGVKLNDEYTRQRGEAGTAFNTNLATLARRRLETDQEYETNKLLAALGLSSG